MIYARRALVTAMLILIPNLGSLLISVAWPDLGWAGRMAVMWQLFLLESCFIACFPRLAALCEVQQPQILAIFALVFAGLAIFFTIGTSIL